MCSLVDVTKDYWEVVVRTAIRIASWGSRWLRPERSRDVAHDLPHFLSRHLTLERRHPRVVPAVPDLVEHHAVRVPRKRQVCRPALAVFPIHVGAISKPFLAVAFLAVKPVLVLAFLNHLGSEGQRVLLVRRAGGDGPAALCRHEGVEDAEKNRHHRGTEEHGG